jgi:hypothetical protein
MTGRLWPAANGLFLLLFAFSAIVQVNDPDPLLWIAIYAAAAVLCGLEMRQRTPWWAAPLVGVIALLWAGTIAPRVLGVVPFASMFQEFEMKDAGVEESREMYGLTIVAVWMLAITSVASLRQLHRRRERAR